MSKLYQTLLPTKALKRLAAWARNAVQEAAWVHETKEAGEDAQDGGPGNNMWLYSYGCFR
jgi:hypothetical protein